jgi:hypothetical protein
MPLGDDVIYLGSVRGPRVRISAPWRKSLVKVRDREARALPRNLRFARDDRAERLVKLSYERSLHSRRGTHGF